MWGDMVERGQVANNPFDEVEIAKEAKPKPRLVSRETVDKVVSMIPKDAANRLRDIALIKVLFTSGMRASEVAGVGQRDLSTTAGAADVTGKGQKQRRVRFSPSAAKAVDDYVNKERSQLPDAPYQPYLQV
jgi:site-specific recombinase XerD